MINLDPISGLGDRELVNYLQSFVTPERYKRFLDVLKSRTRFLTIVLEDIYQPHNASAALRSCDCFGIQDVHIIENRNKYEVNPDVALGSSKWLNLIHYTAPGDKTVICLNHLKQQGYRLVATSPHRNDFTPESLPLDEKTALLFGTELSGLTPIALEMADDFIRIPMVGFTESLNISVSVAILLQNLTQRLWKSPASWRLQEEERNEILLQWLRQSINGSEQIIQDLRKKETGNKNPGR
ncbi:MAG: RNA methyltransferase [Bacteroidales bacterium]|jgi:tRNA (guanosine-2'-O-)-methyltransferase|nr:RNA methyltransferase [Bacteroidales bacterium]